MEESMTGGLIAAIPWPNGRRTIAKGKRQLAVTHLPLQKSIDCMFAQMISAGQLTKWRGQSTKLKH
jgi:hypothetical protein